jgi:hypothetical protein
VKKREEWCVKQAWYVYFGTASYDGVRWMSSRQGPSRPYPTGRRTPWSIWNECVMCCLCILRGRN